MITVRKHYLSGSTLTDPDTVELKNPSGAWGVRRTDLPVTDSAAVIVAAGVDLTRESTGVYSFLIDEPAPGLEYEYSIRVVNGGEVWYDIARVTGEDVSASGNLYTLLPSVQVRLKQCPEALQMGALRDWAQLFCRLSGVWREEVEITTVANQSDYALPALTDRSVLRVEAICYADTGYPVPLRFSALTTDTLRVYPAPSTVQTWRVTVTWLPKPGCAEYPAWLLDRFGSAIWNGAVSGLMAMPEKPWSGDGSAYAWEFQAGVNMAKGETLLGRAELPQYRQPKFV